MTYQFTVSPDFPPDLISGWYVFNTFLQRQLGEGIHLELHDDFASQRSAIDAGVVDLIYANPFDAALLVREHGFTAVARPVGKHDEVVVAVPEASPAQAVEDLRPGTRVVSTDDPDVELMGMILLEPADLDRSSVEPVHAATYVLVAKALIDGRADVGFFLEDAWSQLSGLVRRQLRPLVTSQISVITHALMVGPRMAHLGEALTGLLESMADDPACQHILEGLGLQGWDRVEPEETEFMIDLMDTLLAGA